MEPILEKVRALYQSFSDEPLVSIDKIPQSGSDRSYFRLNGAVTSVIATFGNNIRENETFIYFSNHFKSMGCPVPRILVVSEDRRAYLQEDFGEVSLLNCLEKYGYTEEVYALFQQSLRRLAELQVRGDSGLDYSKCITSQEFGKQAILSDLLYFKYYFLDTLQLPYDKEKLIDDFEALSTYLTRVDHKYFMFRDFQSRNIIVRDGQVYFIDFQGGMKGALQYDVASMLWQARAELPDNWKTDLLEYYIGCLEEIMDTNVDRVRFVSQYNGYVLIRLLQVLGAYGFRGLFERKAQFLTSIPQALRNLSSFIQFQGLGISVPEFERLLSIIVSDEIRGRFEYVRANNDTPLLVRISSFSYRNGFPDDACGNGGGFVFDCRGILNPGRFEEFKTKTGRDKVVMDFLEQQTKIKDFLLSVFALVDISVEDYIKRGFSDLQVGFGCTGGQHRSVYAADALAKHLRNKFHVKVQVNHLVQEAKNWVNLPY
jgi:aminoglycoside/choline kinase family phosphotransferase